MIIFRINTKFTDSHGRAFSRLPMPTYSARGRQIIGYAKQSAHLSDHNSTIYNSPIRSFTNKRSTRTRKANDYWLAGKPCSKWAQKQKLRALSAFSEQSAYEAPYRNNADHLILRAQLQRLQDRLVHSKYFICRRYLWQTSSTALAHGFKTGYKAGSRGFVALLTFFTWTTSWWSRS